MGERAGHNFTRLKQTVLGHLFQKRGVEQFSTDILGATLIFALGQGISRMLFPFTYTG